jgi:hypothetical protein
MNRKEPLIMLTTDTDTRDAFITGLFALAVYLEAHPGIPVPVHGTEILAGACEAEDGGAADIQHAAVALAASVVRTETGGYETCRSFGPVGYKIFSLTKASMARHYAETSYRGCVIPADA